MDGQQLLELDLDQVDFSETQTRAEQSDGAVKEYAQDILAGEQLPPGIAYFDEREQRYYGAAGKHRLEAHRQAGRQKMQFFVRKGTKVDALLEGLADNLKHGVRLTRADKQFAIRRILKECHGTSDQKISRRVGVDHKTIGAHRKKMEAAGEIPQTDTRIDSRGRVYKILPPRVGTWDAAKAALPEDIWTWLAESLAKEKDIVELANYSEKYQREVMALHKSRGGAMSVRSIMIELGGEEEAEDDDPFTDSPEVEYRLEGDEQGGRLRLGGPDEPGSAATCETLPRPRQTSPRVPGPSRELTPRKPTTKPVVDILREAQRFLGKEVSARLDQAKGATRDQESYDECRSGLKALSDAIARWQDKHETAQAA